MDFLDSLKQIKNDIKENEKKKEQELELLAIKKKEEELRQDFLDYMNESGVKKI